MKFLFTLGVIIFSIYSSSAQNGIMFPNMEGESLTNEIVNIPEDLKGKYSIIGLAYSKKSEEYLKTWFRPSYYQFLYKPEKPSLFQSTYDIHLYFVPMFTGAKRPAYQSVMKKVKKTVDPKLLPYVLFYKGELKKYKNELQFKGKDLPYFYVLDPTGKIVYSTYGKYTEQKMQEIVDVIEDTWE